MLLWSFSSAHLLWKSPPALNICHSPDLFSVSHPGTCGLVQISWNSASGDNLPLLHEGVCPILVIKQAPAHRQWEIPSQGGFWDFPEWLFWGKNGCFGEKIVYFGKKLAVLEWGIEGWVPQHYLTWSSEGGRLKLSSRVLPTKSKALAGGNIFSWKKYFFPKDLTYKTDLLKKATFLFIVQYFHAIKVVYSPLVVLEGGSHSPLQAVLSRGWNSSALAR